MLFAPARAGRPHAFGEPPAPGERCPFCPGNEGDTPPQIAVVGEPWRIRVFPNKYPPWPGAEVIVESPEHAAAFSTLAHASEVVGVYRGRLEAHRQTPWTALFRNEGRRAGASIDHLHAQLVPLPFVPPRVEAETGGFARATRCPLCGAGAGDVIRETGFFTWIAPRASRLAYQQWIIPKRHVSSMTGMNEDEAEDLASLLRVSAAATSRVTDGTNWAFMNFHHESAHFYVDVMPRLTAIAGLELGTGTFIEIVDPAAAADILRS